MSLTICLGLVGVILFFVAMIVIIKDDQWKPL